MTVFDRLEEQLRASVQATAPTPTPARPESRRRWWGRRGRAPLLVAAATLLVAGGALAATGGLPIGTMDASLVDPHPLHPNVGVGAIRGPRDVLALRVADPAGGPPWSLRVFATSRGGSCVQLGQVYRGVFGTISVVDGHVAFRPLPARPGDGSLCVSSVSHGFPVMHGQSRTVQVGGLDDSRRCGSGTGLEAVCPVSDVRTIRYGLLGPSARGARLVPPDGHTLASMSLSPGTGGAYLFVTPRSARLFQRNASLMTRAMLTGQRVTKQATQAGVPWTTAVRRGNAAQDRVLHDGPVHGTPLARLPGATDAVEARFADGTELRVSGPHHSSAPLPGVGRSAGRAPDVRAPVEVAARGTAARPAFDVSFRAPVAITRFTHGYRLTIVHPTGPQCRGTHVGGYRTTNRDIARGQVVRFTVKASSGSGGGAGAGAAQAWCPGRYTVRVGYHRPADPQDGLLVGTSTFRVG